VPDWRKISMKRCILITDTRNDVAYELKNLNVLLVEDDPSMRFLLRDMLAAFGIEKTVTVPDGTKAFAELRQFPADIIITDWVMEPVDGLDFTRMVRSAPDSPNPFVPIIMLTSQGAYERVQKARDTGVTEYLIKPVTANALYSRIVNVIQNPRQFVRVSEYFGPDRRRTTQDFTGEERRDDETC